MTLANIDSNLITERKSVSGRSLGTRVNYAQSLSASEIKAVLRAKGVTKGLNAKATEILKGEADIRWMTHQALESALRSKGYVPNYADVTGSGAVARFVLPKEEKPKKAISASDEGKKLALAALVSTGMTKEQAEKALRAAGAM